MHRPALLLTFILLAAFSVIGQIESKSYLVDPGAGSRSRNIDLLHMELEVSFEPKKGTVIGKVTHTFKPLQQQVDTIHLDGPKINYGTILLDGETVNFSITEGGITIRPAKPLTWGNEHTLSIEYTAQPRKGLYFIGWNDPNDLSRKQIWTQGQGIDNRHWFPVFDDITEKITTDIHITFDSAYQVLSNGVVVDKRTIGANNVWHYKMEDPHTPYLVMLGIGKYAVRTDTAKSGVLIHNWYYPEYPEMVEPTYRYTKEMMDWMEETFQVPYPWTHYSQIPVQDFMYGAMENTTATIFGDFFVVDDRLFLDRNYIGVNAHELAHQWFGDYVTSIAPEHHWLHESFATHYQKHFERSVFGEDYYQWNRRGELQSVLAAALQNSTPIAHTQAGSARHYPKGSLVLDMLKQVVGDEAFYKVQASYLRQNAFGHVDTHEFYLAFLETLGLNLDWFFDQWIYRGGEPHYEVSYEETVDKKSKTRVVDITVIQAHEMNEVIGLFKMPVDMEVQYQDGSFATKTVWIEDSVTTVRFPNPNNVRVKYVLFDVGSKVIKTTDFPKELKEWTAQANEAKEMIDRYDALVALRDYPLKKTRDLLLTRYLQESFYALRVEAVSQVMTNTAKVPKDFQVRFINDPNARVREAAITSADVIAEELLPEYEKLLTDSSYQVISAALMKLSIKYPENLPRYLELTRDVTGIGNNTKVIWHILAVSVDSAANLQSLTELSSNSYEFLTRRNAMAALEQLNHLNEEVVANLFDAALNPNNRLGGEAHRMIQRMYTNPQHANTIKTYYESQKWEQWEQELLDKWFEW